MTANSLQRKQAQLNKLQPFTDRERSGLDKRDKIFIRDIQIVFKVDKTTALDIYSKANLKSKDQLKLLGKLVRKKMETYYPKSKQGTTNDGINNRILPKPDKSKGEKTTKNKEVKEYLTNPKTQKDKTYSRVLTASYKHPTASKYELQHGVNSLASKRYRANQQAKQHKQTTQNRATNTTKAKGKR